MLYHYTYMYISSTFLLFGTVPSRITLVVLFQVFQDNQKKSNARIEMYMAVNFMRDSPVLDA